MRLVVGLGNPGARYRETPHNAGFRVCDLLAARHAFGPESSRYQGLFRRGRIRGGEVGLLKPETFMNLSGDSVAQALRYLPIEPADVLLVYDELDLPAGRIRIRPGGSPAGHNGVFSVVERLGTREIPRVRIGVGRPRERGREAGHLLGKVRPELREIFEKSIERAADAVEAMLEVGVKEAMNRFNGLPSIGEEEPPPPDLA